MSRMDSERGARRLDHASWRRRMPLSAGVALSAALALLLAGVGVSTLMAPWTVPARAQSGSGCTATAQRTVDPQTVVIGEFTTVTLRAEATCEALDVPVHAVLAVDNSLAMAGPRMAGLRDAVAAFVDAVDLTQSRVGVIAYYRFVEILSELTDDAATLKATGDAFFPKEGSNIALALRGAHDVLERGRDAGVRSPIEVIVLMSGNEHEGDADDVRAEADRIKSDGVLIVTVAMTGDADFQLLEDVATSPQQAYIESEGILYAELLERIAAEAVAVEIDGALVTDTLGDTMELVWGSDRPPARPRGGDLLWVWNRWPSSGITITYQLEPKALGRHPVSRGTTVELRFDRAATETLQIAPEFVDVVAPPTVTPTPPPSPTATTTPRPTLVIRPAFIPIAFRDFCVPDPRDSDFVLLLDTSSSMLQHVAAGEPKLTLATLAASAFVDALRLPSDRASVIAVHGRAVRLLELSGSRAALQVTLARLFGYVGTGSRLDLGIQEAIGVLSGTSSPYPGPSRGDEDRLKVIVLLTDGQTDAGPVRRAARTAREGGVIIFTIGLGTDVDDALLTEIAGDPSRYHRSPDGSDLQGIYRAIARNPACP